MKDFLKFLKKCATFKEDKESVIAFYISVAVILIALSFSIYCFTKAAC